MPVVVDIVEKAKEISLFIYNHTHVLHLMRKLTGGRDLVRPVVTRFSTIFYTLQSMFEKKPNLRSMMTREDWVKSKWVKHKVGK